MATSLNIRIDGLDGAIVRLGEIASRAEHPRGMWEAIGAALEQSTAERFAGGAGPGGIAWPPSLRARFEGGRTLVDSARLMQSITSRASDTGVEVGTNTLYAAIHQFGGTITAKTSKGLRWKYRTAGGNRDSWATKQSVTIPARPFLGIDDDDQTMILAAAEDWLLAGGTHAH